MKALDISSFFVELAEDTPESDLTNLKLQKLLYYTQGKHLAKYGKPAFTEKIEAWKFGPVVPEVYQAFKSCGQFPVTSFDITFDASELADELKDFVATIWHDIGEKYSGFYLVQTTHKSGTPWARFYKQDQRNIELPQSALKEYFSSNEL